MKINTATEIILYEYHRIRKCSAVAMAVRSYTPRSDEVFPMHIRVNAPNILFRLQNCLYCKEGEINAIKIFTVLNTWNKQHGMAVLTCSAVRNALHSLS